MELKLKDIAEIFQVSEKTIYRWIKAKKIPFYRINHQYRFKRDEIDQWLLKNRHELSFKAGNNDIDESVEVITYLRNGGIFYNVAGNDVETVLKSAVGVMPIPEGVDQEMLLACLKNREQMMTTAIGKGIALPHPRNPIVTDIANESLSICFLHQPVDFFAMDNIPVYVLFVILSADQTRHLRLLARLSFLCQQDDFVKLLKKRAVRENLLQFITEHKRNNNQNR